MAVFRAGADLDKDALVDLYLKVDERLSESINVCKVFGGYNFCSRVLSTAVKSTWMLVMFSIWFMYR